MSNPFAKTEGGGGGGPPAIPSRAAKSGESEAEEVVERTLLVKGECLVYRIPPQVELNSANKLRAYTEPKLLEYEALSPDTFPVTRTHNMTHPS